MDGNDREKLVELLNSQLDKFELVVEVKGYREVWIWLLSY
jgi:hypothetical protein